MRRLDRSLQNAMLAAVPNLRAFAVSLSGSIDRADDLVQEALLRGVANIHLFTPGTNMAAWLTTILRNCFLNERRRAGHMVEDPKGSFVAALASQPEQDGRVQACELRVALGKLPVDQREAIILVGGRGLSYLEAAEICHCAVGTIKSRVSRARAQLATLMSVEDTDDFGPDRTVHAALSGETLCWAA